jgi:hypothetical protein
MTENLPDYSTINPPDEKPKPEFDHHERRADLLRRVISAGSPYAVNQSDLADEYAVDRSTICRDMKRLRESVDDALGDDAKLTARTVFERVLEDLQDADDWRASQAAFETVMRWQEWLAELGEQHREPNRSELDVDMRSRHSEVAYTIVREGEGEPLPTTEIDDGTGSQEQVDHEAIGFTNGPVGVEVTPGSGDSEGAE